MANAERNAPLPLEALEGSAWVAAMALLGSALRVVLTQLGEFDGAAFFPSLVPNVLGCAAMGLLLRREVARRRAGGKGLPPATLAGLTTGFCGSITSFSAWHLDAAATWFGWTGPRLAASRRTWNAALQLIAGLGVFCAAFALGDVAVRAASEEQAADATLLAHRHHGSQAPPYESGRQDQLPVTDSGGEERDSSRSRGRRRRVVVSCVVAGVLWLASAGVAAFAMRSWNWAFLLLLSPLGALLRANLALLNVRAPRWHAGTLTANALACSADAVVFAIAAHRDCFLGAPAESLLRGAVHGVTFGFCGCLSTVSGFAAELVLRSHARDSLRYAATSLLIGQLPFLLAFGAQHWAEANSARLCRL
jgi:fluoride ion exporter CrcB/FEX